jgi:hypothetical protein
MKPWNCYKVLLAKTRARDQLIRRMPLELALYSETRALNQGQHQLHRLFETPRWPILPTTMQKAFLLSALLVVCLCVASAQHPHASPKPGKIPASGNVTDLNEYTFSQTADGRVWFVEFYAEFCRNCR